MHKCGGARNDHVFRLKNWERKRDSEEKELDGKFEQLKAGMISIEFFLFIFGYPKVCSD